MKLNISTKSIAGFALVMLCVSLSTSLFACPQVEKNFLLPSGAVVPTPICYEDTLSLTVEFSADLKKINDLLAVHHVYAVPMNGRAMIQISGVNHRKTNIGQYHEVVVGILATKNADNQGGNLEFAKMFDVPGVGPLSEDVFIFSLGIWVDTSLSLDAGRIIWGLPKELSNITLITTSGLLNRTQGFQFTDTDGSLIMSATWQSPLMPFPQYLDTYIVSPTTLFQTQSRAWFSALGTRGKWNKEGDSVYINSETPFGKILNELDLRPENKIYVPHNKSLFFAPLE